MYRAGFAHFNLFTAVTSISNFWKKTHSGNYLSKWPRLMYGQRYAYNDYLVPEQSSSNQSLHFSHPMILYAFKSRNMIYFFFFFTHRTATVRNVWIARGWAQCGRQWERNWSKRWTSHGWTNRRAVPRPVEGSTCSRCRLSSCEFYSFAK